jgi:signal recognition particle receptor subunit alpha
MRKWDAEGMADDTDGVPLDYSAAADDGSAQEGLRADSSFEEVRPESFGTRTKKGEFVLKDLDNEVEAILKGASDKSAPEKSTSGVVGSSIGAISGLFRNFVGGKVLTKEDLEKPLKGMQEHLVNKNVAQEAAVRLCEGLERELAGVKTGNFESKFLSAFLTSLANNVQVLTPLSGQP